MKVQLWGTRGSVPTPLRPAQIRDKVVDALSQYHNAGAPDDIEAFYDELPFNLRSTFGGDTCCTAIDNDDNETLIIDAGSGIRSKGNDMMANFKGPQVIHIFLSHLHWDHIQGLPFFVPAFVPGNQIHFHSLHSDYEANLRNQQQWKNFPVSIDEMCAEMSFHELKIGQPITIGSCEITPFPHVHPGDSYGFIIKSGDHKVVYSSDCDHVDMTPEQFESYTAYFDNADLLIFDAQYTLKEIVTEKYQWGHSSFSVGLDMARIAGVKRICFFHHDPSSSDEHLTELYERAIQYKGLTYDSQEIEIIWGHDGLEIQA